DRPPRIQPELPVATVTIPAPPKREPTGLRQLVQLGLPLLTVIAFASVSLSSGTGRGPVALLLMSLAAVAATRFAIYGFLQDRRNHAEEERAYSTQLLAMNREMCQYHEQQRRFAFYNYPGPETILSIPGQARDGNEREHRKLRSDARLWERRTTD